MNWYSLIFASSLAALVCFPIGCDAAFAVTMVQEPESAVADEATASKATPRTLWELDNRHTSLIFAASHSGLSYIYGKFSSVSGSVIIDSDRPNNSKFSFTIDPASIDTNNQERDQRLRSTEFLDVAQYDSASFKSTDVKLEVKPQPSGEPKRVFIVGGNLTLHGQTRRVVLPVELLAARQGKDGRFRCGFMSKFVIKRSSHGIDSMPEVVGDSVAITFSFQAIQKPASPTAPPTAQRQEKPKAEPNEEIPVTAAKEDGTETDAGSAPPKVRQEKIKQLFHRDSGATKDGS